MTGSGTRENPPNADFGTYRSCVQAAVIGIVASGVLLAAAWNRLSAGLSSMQRSRDEFNRNISWIKSTLRGQLGKPGTKRHFFTVKPFEPVSPCQPAQIAISVLRNVSPSK